MAGARVTAADCVKVDRLAILVLVKRCVCSEPYAAAGVRQMLARILTCPAARRPTCRKI